MATGNLLLGLGRRSIGDITLYRTRGLQRARVRVRVVANPRSIKQLATRAILSNISQLYSIGRSVFDHAFEGRPVGQENQLRFQKVNIARLRSFVNSDIEEGWVPEEQNLSRIGMRGVSNGVPFAGLQISEGSLSQNVFTFDGDEINTAFAFTGVDEADTTVGAFLTRRGFVDNDIFTFVAFCVNTQLTELANFVEPDVPSGNEPYYKMWPTEFYYIQLRVPVGATQSTTAISATTKWSDVFSIVGANTSVETPLPSATLLAKNSVQWTDVITGISDTEAEILKYPGCWGCIRSRYNTDLRSTSFLEWQAREFGLTPYFLARAWGDEAGLQTSPDLILPGENF